MEGQWVQSQVSSHGGTKGSDPLTPAREVDALPLGPQGEGGGDSVFKGITAPQPVPATVLYRTLGTTLTNQAESLPPVTHLLILIIAWTRGEVGTTRGDIDRRGSGGGGGAERGGGGGAGRWHRREGEGEGKS